MAKAFSDIQEQERLKKAEAAEQLYRDSMIRLSQREMSLAEQGRQDRRSDRAEDLLRADEQIERERIADIASRKGEAFDEYEASYKSGRNPAFTGFGPIDISGDIVPPEGAPPAGYDYFDPATIIGEQTLTPPPGYEPGPQGMIDMPPPAVTPPTMMPGIQGDLGPLTVTGPPSDVPRVADRPWGDDAGDYAGGFYNPEKGELVAREIAAQRGRSDIITEGEIAAEGRAVDASIAEKGRTDAAAVRTATAARLFTRDDAALGSIDHPNIEQMINMLIVEHGMSEDEAELAVNSAWAMLQAQQHDKTLRETSSSGGGETLPEILAAARGFVSSTANPIADSTSSTVTPARVSTIDPANTAKYARMGELRQLRDRGELTEEEYLVEVDKLTRGEG